MTGKAAWLGFGVLSGVTLALVYFFWMTAVPLAVPACDACSRPIHDGMKAVGRVDSGERIFCCPTCAVTDHRQTGKVVDITYLSDHDTAEPIAPEEAFIVEGSSVNHCMMQHAITDPVKQTVPMDFDRCAPSMIAFGSREAADGFARKHGGTVHPFGELAAAYRQ